jgi:hypothetical protein
MLGRIVQRSSAIWIAGVSGLYCVNLGICSLLQPLLICARVKTGEMH